MIATLTTLGPYLVCALAELKQSWRNARNWALVALVALVVSLYALFAIFGSGLEVILWSLVLTIAGLPFYALARRQARLAVASA